MRESIPPQSAHAAERRAERVTRRNQRAANRGSVEGQTVLGTIFQRPERSFWTRQMSKLSRNSKSSLLINSSPPLTPLASTSGPASTATPAPAPPSIPPTHPLLLQTGHEGRRTHSWIFSLLNPSSHKPQAKVYKIVITALILISLFSFIVSTVDSLNDIPDWNSFFYVVEAVSSCCFLVEYVARIVVVVEARKYEHPVWGRVRWGLSFSAIVDLASCLPFFIELIFNRKDLPNLTGLRVLRIFRILKTSPFAGAFGAAYRVIWFNSEIMMVALLICVVLMLLTSATLYYLQPPDAGEGFGSIPETMFLSVMMLTGQGGPDGPLPWYTKLVVMTTALFSVAIFAIPASMLTWGFEAEAERLFRKKASSRKRQQLRRAQGLAIDSDSSTSGSDSLGSDSSAWDEYEAVVAGDEEGEEAATPSTRALNNLVRLLEGQQEMLQALHKPAAEQQASDNGAPPDVSDPGAFQRQMLEQQGLLLQQQQQLMQLVADLSAQVARLQAGDSTDPLAG